MGNVLGELIDFMDHGYRGFGLYGGNPDGSCECGFPECKAAFKHPRNSNWQVTPEWSDEQLEGLEALGHYDTGYGVLVKGLLVVDIDARNGGVESFAKLCKDIDMDLTHNCGLVVQTGSGHGSMHLYYKAPEGVSLIQSHKDYKGIDFKSSGFCVGPGSLHASGNRYQASHGSPREIGVAPDALVNLLVRPDAYRADHEGMPVDVTDGDLRDMLSYISPDCDRATWISIGMALHHTTGGAGFDLWDSWSQPGQTYPGAGNLRNQWDRFGKAGNPVTIGSIFYHAHAGGWKEPETEMPEFAPGTWFAELAGVCAKKPVEAVEEEVPVKATGEILKVSTRHAFSIDGVDLKRPPGFVGEVCKWINSQSRYPREALACAGALQAVGNIAGLRYRGPGNTTTNLFQMCVAGSSTGKEAILQAVADVLDAAGMSRATVGTIKSEQEIIRNLLDNQAANYLIDEFGILLRTITQSKESYHSGVIGSLMSAYSKANSYMPLSGDVKRDVRKTLMSELANVQRQLNENEGDPARLESRLNQLQRAIAGIDRGIEAPFLSMMGFTTGVTFNDLVTYEQATNGFIGRSLITQEPEDNPRRKAEYKPEKMTDRMRLTLLGLYDGGHYDSEVYRIENYGNHELVPMTAGAERMMDEVYEWSYTRAELHKETTGLEAVVRRAYEHVAKVALILGCPGRLITEEHVRWAYAFIERDIRYKCGLAHSNALQQQLNKEDSDAQRDHVMMMRIKARLETGDAASFTVLRNAISRKDPVAFDRVTTTMMLKGMISIEEVTGPTGRKSRQVALRRQAD